MLTRQASIRLQLMLALAAGLAATGCSEGKVLGPNRGGAQAGHVALYSNAQKYRDSGMQPVSGRTGTASITVLGVVGSDGTTELTIEAGAPGTLASVQIKTIDANGNYVTTVTHTGLTGSRLVVTLHDPLPGAQIQVQANVRDVTGMRTEVVTVIETVKMKPDIAVGAISAPQRAIVDASVVISALISELNGNLGAHANCVLYDGDVAIDQALGIWVDAGGSVSCAFSTSFATPGTRTLRVAAEDVDPSDWDTSNNAAQVQIAIDEPPPPPPPSDPPFTDFFYDAMASDYELHQVSTASWIWQRLDADERREFSQTQTIDQIVQDAKLSGFTEHYVSFPVDIDLSQLSGGNTLHALNLTDQAPDRTDSTSTVLRKCIERGDSKRFFDSLGQPWDYTPYVFHMCTQRSPLGGEFTSISYERFAGDVTYRSRGYDIEYQNGQPVADYSYQLNNDLNATIPGRQPYGSDFQFRVRITGSEGRVLELNPIFALAPFSDSQSQDEICSTHPWQGDGSNGTLTTCTSFSLTINGVSGFKHGEPAFQDN